MIDNDTTAGAMTICMYNPLLVNLNLAFRWLTSSQHPNYSTQVGDASSFKTEIFPFFRCFLQKVTNFACISENVYNFSVC